MGFSMTILMRIERKESRRMRPTDVLCSPIKIEVSIYHHKTRVKGKVSFQGHYLRVNGLFSIWTPPKIQPFQFIGLHKCLCITIARPEPIRDLMGIAMDLQRFGRSQKTITWLGTARSYVAGVGLKMYISSKIWNPKVPSFSQVYKTAGIVEAVIGAQRKPYYLLNIPALTRKVMMGS